MNYKTFFVAIIGLLVVGFAPELLAIEQPSFVTGKGENAAQDAGARVYQIIAGVVSVLAAIGAMVGAAFFAIGKPDEGKRLLINAGLGLFFGGCISILFYIAG